MGEKTISTESDKAKLRRFTQRVLEDLRALERIIADGRIERDVRRIGAEQEIFIVDGRWRPALAARELLAALGDKHYTTEIALFNLEMNLDPQVFQKDCLSRMEAQLRGLVDRAREEARRQGLEIVLTGILPTIRKSDLGLESMVPEPRYHALSGALDALRGGAYELHIKGLDEVILQHETVMLEACNTSFQAHFQVAPDEFANLYNISQVAVGPVLAAASNSPLFFGRRLWHETRIALFQQAIDTRNSLDHLRERSPRVTFGNRWVEKSVLELYREDVGRFRALVASDLTEEPFALIAQGKAPKLQALTLHNSTVYRWNRACYGVTAGNPHLRIENRVMPSGPTIVDEMANTTFWLGVVCVLSDQYDDIRRVMRFSDAKLNFAAAARQGLRAQFHWLEGEILPARALICDRLIPQAAEALARRGIDGGDVQRYLGILDARVRSGQTGSEWLLRSFEDMGPSGSVAGRLTALTAATVARQEAEEPVHTWAPARIEEGGSWKHSFHLVEEFMTTDLFTVHEDEPVELVANLMDWERIRHVPVEDHAHRLVGLVSYRALLRLMARGWKGGGPCGIPVSEIMHPDPITVPPETSTLEAIRLMRQHDIGCLPVVKNGQLIGIVTQSDFMTVARDLLEQKLKET